MCTLGVNLTVFPFRIDNEHEKKMFILVFQHQEWIARTFEFTDSIIYSLVVHENRLWFFDDDGNLFISTIDLNNLQVHIFGRLQSVNRRMDTIYLSWTLQLAFHNQSYT